MLKLLRLWKLNKLRQELASEKAEILYWKGVFSVNESVSTRLFEKQSNRLGRVARLNTKIAQLEKGQPNDK